MFFRVVMTVPCSTFKEVVVMNPRGNLLSNKITRHFFWSSNKRLGDTRSSTASVLLPYLLHSAPEVCSLTRSMHAVIARNNLTLLFKLLYTCL
jgi:hypothetical protein